LGFVAGLASVAAVLGRTDRDLASQLRRAAESQAVIDVGRALGLIGDEQWQALDHKLDRVCAMLYRLRG